MLCDPHSINPFDPATMTSIGLNDIVDSGGLEGSEVRESMSGVLNFTAPVWKFDTKLLWWQI